MFFKEAALLSAVLLTFTLIACVCGLSGDWYAALLIPMDMALILTSVLFALRGGAATLGDNWLTTLHFVRGALVLSLLALPCELVRLSLITWLAWGGLQFSNAVALASFAAYLVLKSLDAGRPARSAYSQV